jgi:hypothetical protein
VSELTAPRRGDEAPSWRALVRAVRPWLGSAGDADRALEGAPLEARASGDPPVVAPCRLLEPWAARPVAAAERSGVCGFLDGIQRSRVLAHRDGVPVVAATVAAAIRERHDRTLSTWGAPVVHRGVYLSRLALEAAAPDGAAAWAEVLATGLPVCDTTEGAEPQAVPLHPRALQQRALERVALERERAERQLAAAWCRAPSGWLWVDGGIAGNVAIDAEAPAFGVVKAHTTLYGAPGDVRRLLALGEGARGPLLLVGHRLRRAVASWYLRLRPATAQDPLHGLVRVEVAPPPGVADASGAAPEGVAALAALADRLSGWILAERAPVALPDPRWDTLTYGIHACERYLAALVGPA